jgi:hypothetical protein
MEDHKATGRAGWKHKATGGLDERLLGFKKGRMKYQGYRTGWMEEGSSKVG